MKKFFEEMKEERKILEKFIATFITNVGARFRRLGNKLKKKSREERVAFALAPLQLKKDRPNIYCCVDRSIRIVTFRARVFVQASFSRKENFVRGREEGRIFSSWKTRIINGR